MNMKNMEKKTSETKHKQLIFQVFSLTGTCSTLLSFSKEFNNHLYFSVLFVFSFLHS